MPSVQLTNPAGAFGYNDTGGWQTISLQGAAAINQGQALYINSSGQAAVATGSEQIIGVAGNTTTAAGQTVEVVVCGVVTMTCGSGGVTAGDAVAAGASGTAVAASTTIGENIGVAVSTATDGNPVNVFVSPR